jgi:hypothetical protein
MPCTFTISARLLSGASAALADGHGFRSYPSGALFTSDRCCSLSNQLSSFYPDSFFGFAQDDIRTERPCVPLEDGIVRLV